MTVRTCEVCGRPRCQNANARFCGARCRMRQWRAARRAALVQEDVTGGHSALPLSPPGGRNREGPG